MVSSVLRMTLAVRLSFVRDCCAIFSVHRQRLDFAAWFVLFRQQRGSWSAGYPHSRNHWKLWDLSMPPRRLQAVTQAIEFEHSLLTEWTSLNCCKSGVRDYPQQYISKIFPKNPPKIKPTNIHFRSANFFLLGCVGSALVSFTVSAACWSFLGKEAPVGSSGALVMGKIWKAWGKA